MSLMHHADLISVRDPDDLTGEIFTRNDAREQKQGQGRMQAVLGGKNLILHSQPL
jgi:hypothetical protein